MKRISVVELRQEVAGAARRRLAKLGRKECDRIDEKIMALASEPRPHGVETLTDQDGLFRMRAGPYRVVFSIDDEERVIAVQDIRGRDDIYRKRGVDSRVLPERSAHATT